jgi:hypothetical protein
MRCSSREDGLITAVSLPVITFSDFKKRKYRNTNTGVYSSHSYKFYAMHCSYLKVGCADRLSTHVLLSN